MGWKDGRRLSTNHRQPLRQAQGKPLMRSSRSRAPLRQSAGPSQSGWRSGQPLNQPSAPAAAASSTAPSGQSAQPTWTDYLLQHLAAGSPWDPNAPAKTLATTPFWQKPADASWGDYAAAHFQPVDDAVRSATNVFGAGD